MEEEASFLADNAEDQLKAVGREREDERAEFIRKLKAAEESAKTVQKASDVAKVAPKKCEGKLRAALVNLQKKHSELRVTENRVRKRSEVYEATLHTRDERMF